MPRYTLEVAQEHLNSWLDAELALSTGQSYTIGTRSLTRANLADVMAQIKYWQRQVDECLRQAAGLRPHSRVRRYVPTDL
ncbi:MULTISPECIES: DUF6148 family protein [unclassified Paenibacillus]|uniref:DUF6148 family protein n=1 Tax=unclassified Paenibacillus TaxID=185978 RepID=UPI00240732C4|nr:MULTISPECIES: DUF6148 family protein [unclassified Paenibacillus]MDF9845548.1 hypothetical protein [Paenibacillus sp. PastF-2]MDF9852122.1 hypothetical protein [Paenibacillus sp. PastM-2]MDF9858703.1 hypothetical protein [Paenibacillus sp. PastF-1]MDH6483959.1 hypothetical protein [Paenibacillus sp. PastH-2]MDH6511338.1 hypothetical protein [Paenibacillus sp. PastM-3]